MIHQVRLNFCFDFCCFNFCLSSLIIRSIFFVCLWMLYVHWINFQTTRKSPFRPFSYYLITPPCPLGSVVTSLLHVGPLRELQCLPFCHPRPSRHPTTTTLSRFAIAYLQCWLVTLVPHPLSPFHRGDLIKMLASLKHPHLECNYPKMISGFSGISFSTSITPWIGDWPLLPIYWFVVARSWLNQQTPGASLPPPTFFATLGPIYNKHCFERRLPRWFDHSV